MRVSFCCITLNAARTLPRMLSSIRPLAAEIIAVDTGSTDATVPLLEAAGARVVRMDPTDDRFFLTLTDEAGQANRILSDFSTARNLSFASATGDALFWIDADDVLVGTEHWYEMLDQYEQSRADGVILPYDYAADAHGNVTTVLHRERLVRAGLPWRWEGYIHEVLNTKGRTFVLYDRLRVKHLREKKEGIWKRRNLEVLLAKGDPSESRRLYYLGVEYAFLGQYNKAGESFEKFLAVATDADEIYHALYFLGDICRTAGRQEQALNYYQRAIVLKPTWREAYFGMGMALGHLKDWERSLFFITEGLRQPERPHTLLAFNPKHQAIGWVDWAVTAYQALGRISEAIETARVGLRQDPSNQQLFSLYRACIRAYNQDRGEQALQEAVEYLARQDKLADAHLVACQAQRPAPIYEAVREAYAKAQRGGVAAATLRRKSNPRSLEWLIGALAQRPESREIYLHALADLEVARTLTFSLPQPIRIGATHPQHLAAFDALIPQSKRDRIKLTAADLYEGLAGQHDAIVLFDVLQHVAFPVRLLRAATEWLAPGGSLFLAAPSGPEDPDREVVEAGNLRATQVTASLIRYGLRQAEPPRLLVEPDGRERLVLEYRKDGSACEALGLAATPRRIAFLCGPALEKWGPHSLEAGIGGSEEAVIHLSRALARRGHAVTVYGPDRCTDRWDGNTEAVVRYRPMGEYSDADLCVAWRVPEFFCQRKLPRAEWHWLWLHDTIEPKRVIEAAAHCDRVLVQSHFHASLYPEIGAKLCVDRNGIVPEPIDARWIRSETAARTAIWTSCPTRGLEPLLEFWPQIRARVPGATLRVFYGWNNVDAAIASGAPHAADLQRKKARIQALLESNGQGVLWHGRRSQAEVWLAMLNAGAWLYPTDFPEVSCISAMKAQAAGCWPVYYPYAALPETVAWGYQSTPENFVDHAVDAMTGGRPESERMEMARWALAAFDWAGVACQWERLLHEA